MTTELVAIRRPVTRGPFPPHQNKPRMTIASENGSVQVAIPYAPREVNHTDLGGTYATINRPGLTDVMTFVNEKVPKMSMDLFVSDRSNATVRGQQIVTALGILQALQGLAKSPERVRVSYGQFESGLWNLDSMSIKSTRRHPSTDEIMQADVSLSFTRASDVFDGVGPTTGGVKPTSVKKPPAKPQKTSSKKYTVKRGDTLWAISVKFYGTGTKWRRIADANKIKNPRTLQVGKVLRIP